ncbi:hypothetical protein LLG46_04230 [bacterium]|nr:hypothetical protein [bacterium]
MSTRSFIHPTRFMQAILILSLCFILTGSTFAARSNNQDRGKNDKPSVSKRVTDNKDSAKPDKASDNKRTQDNNRDKGDARDTKSDRPSKPATDNKKPNQPDKRVNDRDKNASRDRDRDRDRDRYISRPQNSKTLVRREIAVQCRYPSKPNYRPAHYTHWVFDIRSTPSCRKSVYFYFGYLPYVSTARVYVDPYIYVEYRSAPVIISNGYYLYRQHTTQLDDALADIRSAWLDGRVDLIKRHISSSMRIAVLLDGKYDYSVDSDDYADMTNDAIDQMNTVGFVWESVRQRTDGNYTASAKHTYIDDSGQQKSVYVSYTLDRYYDIVEVGSSETSLNYY